MELRVRVRGGLGVRVRVRVRVVPLTGSRSSVPCVTSLLTHFTY